MWLYLSCLVLFHLLAFNITPMNIANSQPNTTPLWTWECVYERCVPLKTTKTSKFQTITTCNMLCRSLQLWPQPTGPVSLTPAAVPIRVDLLQLRIVTFPSAEVYEHLQDAFDILRNDLRKLERSAHGFAEWRSVVLRVSVNGSGDPRMLLNTDESYKFSLRHSSNTSSFVADIFANSFCGARHAFETLSQLIWLDTYAGTLLILEEANVEDAPRFPYRGLMLDTARNYFPVGDIMRTIDAMAACKLNTFHWHASDAQSFPLKLSNVPELFEFGSYGPGFIYTTEDVQAVVRRARLRGIRVLIEVDVPAHVGDAWQWSPDTKLGNFEYCMNWTKTCVLPPCGQLNPHNPHVHKLLERIYGEIIQLTDVDDIFHLGGDDISESCWASHTNDSDPIELWLEFTKSVLDRLEYVNGKLPNLTIFWFSKISDRLKSDLKDYIHIIGLQAHGTGWAQKYVSGVRTVVSHEDAWDLNSGIGEWYEKNEGTPYNSWQRIYEYRPWLLGVTGPIEGGEATVWSTSLTTGGLDAHIWPRAAALAERLWSDRSEGVTRTVQARLDVHRGRLTARGVQAAPLWSMWCSHNPFTCN